MRASALLRRVSQFIPVVIVVSMAVFALVRLMPGDPAVTMAGADASAETIAAVRATLGLDRPIHEQYITWVGNLVDGELGTSLSTRQPVIDELRPHAAATVQLALAAMALALVAGLTFGILAAYFRGRWIDRALSAFGMLAISLPAYWVGLVLILIFSVRLGLLPTGGNRLDWNLVLPAVTLALPQTGMLMRLTRGVFVEILDQDFIRSARTRGLSEARIVVRHALPNGGVTLLTFTALQLGHVLAGAVAVEVVFAWPGLGRLAVDALLDRDLPVVQATILLFAVTILVINLIADVLYIVIDPRIGSDS